MTQLNLRSEQIKSEFVFERGLQDLAARSSEDTAASVDAYTAHQAAADAEQMAYLREWQRTHPQARKTTWRDVRALLAVPVILAACAGALWLFVEWQALGGWGH